MLSIAATILLSLPVTAQNAGPQNAGSEAKTAIDAAVAAMGTAGLQSVQYSGTGSFFATGQAERFERLPDDLPNGHAWIKRRVRVLEDYL